MNNRLITEEIRNFILLSNYNSKKTLTENMGELNEVKPSSFTKGLQFAEKEAHILSRDLDALKGGMPNLIQDLNLSTIRNQSEFLQLMSKSMTDLDNMFKQALENEIKSGHIVKTGSELGSKSKDISKAIAMRRILDERPRLENLSAAEQAVQIQKILDDTKQRSKTRAFEVNQGGGGKPKPTKPVITSPIVTLPIVTLPIPEPWWRELWKNKTFKNAMLVAAGAGGAALLYWWMSGGKDDEKVIWIPDCLKMIHPNGSAGFTQNDLMKMAEKGSVDSLPMTSAGVTDSSGNSTTIPNAVFHKDGTFESPMGSGTWVDRGGNVQINAGGNVYIIDCSNNTTPPPVPTPVPIPVKTDECNGNYTTSTTFPFRMCQQSKEIGDVQKCLGITPDTKFGLQTKNALGKGYLTRTEYDSIMKDCQGGTTTISPERNKTGGSDL